MRFSKEKRRKKIKMRIRKKVSGTSLTPRLAVYRSNKEIYCQLIDDTTGVTIAGASSKDKGIDAGVSKIEQAKQVGKIIANKAQSANISQAVFDRSGYLYHGRIKSLADGAREGGLSI